jgi:heptaprenyl diphosphate synthase
VLAGSLLLGQFLAPGFFLSLSGALASLVVLGLAMHLPARWFGPVSHSILAAFAHIGAQLVVARLWLVPHDGVFYLTPVFALAAVVFGLLNGLVAARLLRELQRVSPPPGDPMER